MSDEVAPEERQENFRKKWTHMERQFSIIEDHHFAVVIDKEGDVDWETDEEWDAIGPINRAKHGAVLNDAALLEAVPCDELSSTVRLRYKRLIGEAIARSLDHDYQGAAQMIAAAKNYVRDRSEELSRGWYLSASAAMAFFCLVLALMIWIFRSFVVGLVGPNATWTFLSIAAGAGGALLSVIGRSGRLHFDCSAGRNLHYLEGASRIWAGNLAGLFTAFAVKSGLLLAPVTQAGKQDVVLLTAAFVAGASERFATSIISKFGAHSEAEFIKEVNYDTGNNGAEDEKKRTDHR